ncbi:MAG TPA: sigma-70 family RNA polymerase sigma factor [Acidimicrobiia bacterium]|nr:sigma-70 family RNA polymerase sigma factor [Acidimicrobiia bacterium]
MTEPSELDDRGFDEWYRAHYRRVFASLYLVCGDRDACAEAVDEAFARAYERWTRVRRMASPEGWTWVVARNRVRAERRATRRRTAVASRLVADTETRPVELSVVVWDAVNRLPPREREVIALRYLAGLRERDIAAALRIAPGTVARALHDARGHLALSLGETDVEEHGR